MEFKKIRRIINRMDSQWYKETGIKNIVMSGGVAQNIKANKLIAELKDLNNLFIPPGPGMNLSQ